MVQHGPKQHNDMYYKSTLQVNLWVPYRNLLDSNGFTAIPLYGSLCTCQDFFFAEMPVSTCLDARPCDFICCLGRSKLLLCQFRIQADFGQQGPIQIDFSCMPIGAVFNPMPGELFLAGNTGTTSAGSIVLKFPLLHDFGQRTYLPHVDSLHDMLFRGFILGSYNSGRWIRRDPGVMQLEISSGVCRDKAQGGHLLRLWEIDLS